MPIFRAEYRWVPSLYLMQGLPYALVTTVSSILYKNLGFTNTKIAFYTSIFACPWFLKSLFSPFLEGKISKRLLITSMQFSMAGLFFLLSLSLKINIFYGSGFVFLGIALASTIHDINSDGFYLVRLNTQTQAHFVGIRTLFYQIGKFISEGVFIFFMGIFLAHFSRMAAWQINFTLLGFFVLFVAIYHQKILPKEKNANGNDLVSHSPTRSFKNIITDLRNMPHVASVLFFVLIYNVPEAQLIKIVPLFLLERSAQGGLALTVQQVGIIYGSVGIFGLLIGVICASLFLSKYELKKCLTPLTVLMVILDMNYLFLSLFLFHSFWIVAVFIALAKFGFGLSNGAYMFYLLKTFNRGLYPMSLYAIGTTLMGMGMIAGAAVSGYLQSLFGYEGFFIWILMLNFSVLLISIYNAKYVI